MLTYQPHCGDHVPGLSAAAVLLAVFGAVAFGVPDPFPLPPNPSSKPVPVSAWTPAAAPPAGAPVRGNGDGDGPAGTPCPYHPPMNGDDEVQYGTIHTTGDGKGTEVRVATKSTAATLDNQKWSC